MDDKKNDEWRLALCATPSAVLQRPSQASFAWPRSGADGVVVSAKASAHIAAGRNGPNEFMAPYPCSAQSLTCRLDRHDSRLNNDE